MSFFTHLVLPTTRRLPSKHPSLWTSPRPYIYNTQPEDPFPEHKCNSAPWFAYGKQTDSLTPSQNLPSTHKFKPKIYPSNTVDQTTVNKYVKLHRDAGREFHIEEHTSMTTWGYIHDQTTASEHGAGLILEKESISILCGRNFPQITHLQENFHIALSLKTKKN